MVDTPFLWGEGGARLTPEDIAARRKVADALAAKAGDGVTFAPGTRGAGTWTRGLAHVAKGIFEGVDSHRLDEASKVNAAEDAALRTQMFGGVPAVAAALNSTPAAAVASSPMGAVPALAVPARAAVADTSGKIYSNDEPSPLDPPSGQDRVNMIATILGEAGNEPQLGKNAVASVIRTRAVDGGYGGDTPTAVVTAPNQFEPWNTPAGRDRMARAAADPRQAAAAEAAIASAYGEGGKAPEDPTEGMTHFWSPGTQAALGRKPPAWAGGEAVTIGGHVFNSPDDAAPNAKPVQVASATPAAMGFAPDAVAAVNGAAAPAAAPAPAVAKVAGAFGGVNPAVIATMTSPYASESTKKIAGIMLQAQLGKEKKDTYTQETDKDGNIWSVSSSGKRTVELKKDPVAKPTFGIIGEDGEGKKTYGFIDPVGGKVTPLEQPQSSSDKRPTVTGPNGAEIVIPPGVDVKAFKLEVTKATADAATGKKTEVQGNAEQFANRLENAEKAFSKVPTENLGLSGAAQGAAGNILGVGGFLQTENFQKMQQAKMEWVTAVLRKESGAAIGKEEFTSYDKQFFPQPGDKPSVIEQKAEARRVTAEAMKKTAGPGYKSPTPAPAAAAVSDGATAVNPKTGERLIRRDGQWVPSR